MPDQPEKLFDLMDIETEPTDEQLERLMQFVIEDVRRKRDIGKGNLQRQLDEALADTKRRWSAA